MADAALLRVGIVGRPNVGKSTFFNILSRTRKALVKDQPGVTRDILNAKCDWWGKQFLVSDTGGITDSRDQMLLAVKERVLSEIRAFDLLIMVCDGRSGLLPEDWDVLRLAKESGKPLLVLVNKIDQDQERDLLMSEFFELGAPLMGVSLERHSGVDEVVEWILSHIGDARSEEAKAVRLAIVGKPNAGKSSLLNLLLGTSRSLVSDIAGTTVDPVEAELEMGGRSYVIVDTAGLRRPSQRKEGVEYLSALKAQGSIEGADIVLLVVDMTEGLSHQDARIVEFILSEHKPVILVANKFDIAVGSDEGPRLSFRNEVSKVFHFFPDIPVVFMSARTGRGLKDLQLGIQDVQTRLHTRIPTSKLNDFFYRTIRQAPAPVYGTSDVKFYYLTQTEQVPPSFIAFANHPEGVTPSYRRFLTKRIQEQWNLQGIPVRMFVMNRSRT